jgi:hypothetical protein
MDWDFSYVSLTGSAFSTACTAYFWFVKARRERPDLSAHLLQHEFFLSLGQSDTRLIGCTVGIIYANNSILPDAVLGLRLWVRTTNGGWKLMDDVICDSATALPLNLPPQQTCLLRLTGQLHFERDARLESESNIAGGYLRQHVAAPREFKLETLGLNDHVSTEFMRVAPDESAAESFRVRTAA